MIFEYDMGGDLIREQGDIFWWRVQLDVVLDRIALEMSEVMTRTWMGRKTYLYGYQAPMIRIKRIACVLLKEQGVLRIEIHLRYRPDSFLIEPTVVFQNIGRCGVRPYLRGKVRTSCKYTWADMH